MAELWSRVCDAHFLFFSRFTPSQRSHLIRLFILQKMPLPAAAAAVADDFFIFSFIYPLRAIVDAP